MIPEIDLDDKNTETWRRACAECGFFILHNHTIDLSLIESAMRLSEAFFNLSKSEKNKIRRTANNCWGYYDEELTKNRQDWKQILDIGPDAETGPLAGARTQWPALAGFEPTFTALTAELHRVALAVTKTIAASLGAQLPTQEVFEEHSSFLRINYYPLFDDASVGRELERSFGIHPHTDAGAITVLCQDEVASLQVHRDGQWETITKPKDALIINIGDIVQVWSNDRFTAPVHRVLARSDRTRLSIPYFLNPPYNYTYAPLAHEGHRYKPINWGEFRSQRSSGDYADLGHEIQISDFRIA